LAAGFFGYGGQTVDGGCYGADFDLSIVFCKTIKTKVYKFTSFETDMVIRRRP
jgi:hypothetical protein